MFRPLQEELNFSRIRQWGTLLRHKNTTEMSCKCYFITQSDILDVFEVKNIYEI